MLKSNQQLVAACGAGAFAIAIITINASIAHDSAAAIKMVALGQPNAACIGAVQPNSTQTEVCSLANGNVVYLTEEAATIGDPRDPSAVNLKLDGACLIRRVTLRTIECTVSGNVLADADNKELNVQGATVFIRRVEPGA